MIEMSVLHLMILTLHKIAAVYVMVVTQMIWDVAVLKMVHQAVMRLAVLL